MRILKAALGAVVGLFLSFVSQAQTVEHGSNAGWFNAINHVGFIRACQQLNNSPDDGRSWIGVDGLVTFFDKLVANDAELSAKFQRESPVGRRRAIANHDPVEMCVAWSMYQSINKFWAEGRDAFMYAPDSPNYRPYVFPLISINDIIANARDAGREEVKAAYERARAEIQAELDKVLGHIGVRDAAAAIQSYDNVVSDNNTLSGLLERIMARLDIEHRDEILDTINNLFDRITDLEERAKELQAKVNELERQFHIPWWLFWLVLFLLLLLLIALLFFGRRRIKSERDGFAAKENAYKEKAEREQREAVAQAEQGKNRHYAEQERRYQEQLEEKQRAIEELRQKLIRIFTFLGIRDEDELEQWHKRHIDAIHQLQKIITWLWRTLARSHAQPLDLTGTGLRYIEEPTIYLVRSDVKSGRRTGPREAILPYEDAPRPVEDILRDLLEYPNARGPALVELDPAEPTQQAA